MLDRKTFDSLIKDIVANLFDLTALEANPDLPAAFSRPPGYEGTLGEWVRGVVTEAIQQLRPVRGESPASPEWRPYLILQRRYVEGMPLAELAASLAVSDRQMRRDQHRALQALTAVLWQKLFPAQPGEPVEVEAESTPLQVFEIRAEILDARETLRAVARILAQRLEESEASLALEDGPPVPASADRVVLRQILISLLNNAAGSGGPLRARVRAENGRAVIEIEAPGWDLPEDEAAGTLRYWAERIQAGLARSRLETGGQIGTRWAVSLPQPRQRTVLVIDDQGAAINLYRRFLAQSGLSVAGTSRPDEALPLARQQQPALIILDVMMPGMDGWEVLQTLKLDEETRHIPVLVCSAWEEPELSRSLGAAGFLKKPVTQKSLQDALKNIPFWSIDEPAID